MGERTTRRAFLKRAAAAAAAGGLAGPFPGRALGANERIVMGVIGAGGRGRHLMNVFRRHEEVLFAAVCDVYPPNLERACELTGRHARKYADHRKLLEKKGLQAVLIATPEHWHHDHLVDAVRAGLDAYCEKPMSHTIDEAKDMVRVVRSTDRIVQIGTQQRSGPHFRQAKAEVIDRGLLGKVTHVRSWWHGKYPSRPSDTVPVGLDWARFLGSAPRIPLDPRRFWDWRHYWDYSGGICSDEGSHVCDWVQWFMGMDRPNSAVMSGGTFAIEHGEVPDTFTAVWEYPGGWIAEFLVTYGSGFADRHDHGTCFHGTEGSLEVSRGGWRFPGERERRFVQKGGPSDPVGAHVANFLACVRSRREPNAPVEAGMSGVCTTHVANIAYRTRRRIHILQGWELACAGGDGSAPP